MAEFADKFLPPPRIIFGAGRAYKKIERPSWWHPYRRVMWVHHYGPRVPCREVFIGRITDFSVIKGITG